MKRTLIVSLLLMLCISSLAQRFQVKVVGVSDGDTFTAINRDNLQLKIRVYGIDAPEKKQAFGNKSKEALSNLIFGKTSLSTSNFRTNMVDSSRIHLHLPERMCHC